jgi:transketolase
METKDRLVEMRRSILRAAFNAGEGHIASAYSILEIVEAVHTCFPIKREHSDIFVLSKGHASLALYAVLESHGLISNDWVNDFCKFDSSFGGHPDSLKIPQISLSSGSLGHGLPFAVGLALANKARGLRGRITVLVGDGELNEGSNWEALLVATHHKLDNLQLIVDFNHSGDRAINLGDLASKFSSFGCHVVEIEGHNIEQVSEALLSECSEVKAIIAHTIKGYGIAAMQGNPEWHHKAPNQEQFDIFNEELR